MLLLIFFINPAYGSCTNTFPDCCWGAPKASSDFYVKEFYFGDESGDPIDACNYSCGSGTLSIWATFYKNRNANVYAIAISDDLIITPQSGTPTVVQLSKCWENLTVADFVGSVGNIDIYVKKLYTYAYSCGDRVELKDVMLSWDNSHVATCANASCSGDRLNNNYFGPADYLVSPPPSPAISLNKTASPTTVSAIGQINYSYDVSNAGNVPLKTVILVDNRTTAGPTYESGDANMNSWLDLNETWTYSGSYTVTQDDLDSCYDILNNAMVTALDNCMTQVSDQEIETVSVNPMPGISLNKTASPTAVSQTGQINYIYDVSNAGNVPLKTVILVDNRTTAGPTYESGDANMNSWLDLNETWTYSGSYTVTQDDLDSCYDILNNAMVTALDNCMTQVSDQEIETAGIVELPDITLSKTCMSMNISGLGTINYSYQVSNAGNVALDSVELSDDRADADPILISGDNDSDARLDADEIWTYSGAYTVTQDDLDSCLPIANNAQVEALSTCSRTRVSDNDSATVVVNAVPGIALNKTPQTASISGPGTINYSYQVYNTGNAALSSVTLSDDRTDADPILVSGDDDSDSHLDVGEIWTYSGAYTATQEDIDSCLPIANNAQVEALSPCGRAQVNGTASAAVAVSASPGISLNKIAPAARINATGPVSYTYVVSNSGNVALGPVDLSDNRTDSDPILVSGDTDSDSMLDVGEVWSYSGIYTVTQDDLDTCSDLANNAMVEAWYPCDNTSVSALSNANVAIIRAPGISLNKTAAITSVNATGPITYTYEVSNSGNVALGLVDVSDYNLDADPAYVSGDTDSDGLLDVSETWRYAGSYTVTASDIQTCRVIRNTGIVKAYDPCGTAVGPVNSSEVAVATVPTPEISVNKTSNVSSAERGDAITYTAVVENRGNCVLGNVSVTDTMVNLTKVSGDEVNADILDVGEIWTYSGEYTVPDDYDLCQPLSNTVTASGHVCTDIGPLETASSSVTITPVAAPDLSVNKTHDGYENASAGEGDQITYHITVENTGNVALYGVTVTDDKLYSVPMIVGTIEEGGSVTLSPENYTVTQDDLCTGVINTARAEGYACSPQGVNVSATDTDLVPTIYNADIAFDKVPVD
ncbi:MAG TPA: hypothetical protein PLI05_08640 [Methanotrichaceae archaeon]|nr:hypothetical protein [Methanotrichaceae archaeon]HQF17118.1 hypothetical protein [Methanotrichaceae archaeon]HQI91739.1 hypothetical protein [Methanotrichaceae archaeon]HQJ28962.1 hypothetical protein [Methanotrichaceae archaeon]